MDDREPSSPARGRRGAHADVSPPEWSLERYRGRAPLRYAELALLLLLGTTMGVVAATDGRAVAVWVCVAAVACVLVAPALRPPLGALVAAGGLVAAYVAALRGRFDGVEGFIGLGSIATLVLALSVLGFSGEEDRRRTWGESKPFLPVEPGPRAAWRYPRSRGPRFLGEIGGFALAGLLGLAFAVADGTGWRVAVAAAGIVVVLLSAFLRAPAWPVACWAGLAAVLAGGWGLASWGMAGWVAFQSWIVFAYVRDAAWTHRWATEPESGQQG